MNLPAWLGGHEFETHTDRGALEYIIDRWDAKTLVDIGCGPGGQVELAVDLGLDATGVDGDFTLPRPKHPERFIIHDYTLGVAPFELGRLFNFGWCVEVLEHIRPRFLSNIIETFIRCDHIIVTHAFPGQGGHHHVNEQPVEYWLELFAKNNFEFDSTATEELRTASTMHNPYIKKSGLLFHNRYRR